MIVPRGRDLARRALPPDNQTYIKECVCFPKCVCVHVHVAASGACRSAVPTSEQKTGGCFQHLFAQRCHLRSSCRTKNIKNKGKKIILMGNWGDYTFFLLFLRSVMKLCPVLQLTAVISHTHTHTQNRPAFTHKLEPAVMCLFFWFNLYMFLCCSIKTKSSLVKPLQKQSLTWRVAPRCDQYYWIFSTRREHDKWRAISTGENGGRKFLQ